MVSCVAGLIRGPVKTHFFLNESDIAISYLPLAHVLERAVCNLLFYLGASAGIYSQDTTKLLEDVGVLNPTVFVSVPRLFYRIHDAITQGVTGKSRISQFLFNFGKNKKLQKLRQSSSPASVFWDSVCFLYIF
jgi:long-chain acyl-CoA synthetase